MSGSHLCHAHRWKIQLEICGVAWEMIPVPEGLWVLESMGHGKHRQDPGSRSVPTIFKG